MMSLEEYKSWIQKIVDENSWSKTPNVTFLEALRRIIEATDGWRRNAEAKTVVEKCLEAVFYLLATCVKLDPGLDLDSLLTRICETKKDYTFTDLPDDLVWSFIIYSTEPHFSSYVNGGTQH